MNEKLVYIAIPYSSPKRLTRERRHSVANFVTAKLMKWAFKEKRQLAFFSPITYSHALAKQHNVIHAHAFWYWQNMYFLERADLMIVVQCHGWERSKGVAKEIRYAKANKIPVIYFRWD